MKPSRWSESVSVVVSSSPWGRKKVFIQDLRELLELLLLLELWNEWLIHEAVPQTRPVVITIFILGVCPSPLIKIMQNKTKGVKIAIANGGALGLAECIMDDTCLVVQFGLRKRELEWLFVFLSRGNRREKKTKTPPLAQTMKEKVEIQGVLLKLWKIFIPFLYLQSLCVNTLSNRFPIWPGGFGCFLRTLS